MYITERKLFGIALFSNAFFVFLRSLFRINGISIQKILITSFLLFSVLAIILIAFKNKSQLKNISKENRRLFQILIFWGIIVLIRGFSFSIQDWATNFGNVYMGLAWLTPLVLILGFKIENWNVVFKAINIMFFLMLIAFLMLPFYGDIKTEWTWLLRPINFVLLVGLYKYGYFNKVKIVGILLIYFIINIKINQRLEFLYLVLTLGFLLLDNTFSFKIKKRFLKYILGGFIVVFTLIFTVGYEFVSSMVSLVIEYQDTRTFLYKELYGDMSLPEKLFGRGSLGTYYSEFFAGTRRYYDAIGNTAWKGDSPTRITTEVGYLQMILKGGLTLLILNIILALKAVYVALFKSNNKFIRRLGYYVLIITILSLISFRPAFTPTFIIFWMAIGTILNKKYREMTNDEIKKLINIK